jgi:threonine dehydrogenase-like Zn-dependent dehydrogenase
MMKALCWHGKHDVRVESVPEPKILNPNDIIVRVSKAAICGSDLHLYDGFIPTMKEGDILGHEFMGEVVEAGPEVRKLKVGDRVVVPFTISCGSCFFCAHGMWSLCDNSNPNSIMAEKLYGYSGAGLFGYSHIFGGYAGGQAQYVRVPFADVGPIKIPSTLEDDQVLFLSDIFPTGYMAAENCNITQGDTIAVWGCGPVGLFAIKSAYLLGAHRVIAIDRYPDRLKLAREECNAEVINFEENNVEEVLQQMTGGQGPDACIDAVGLEGFCSHHDSFMDRAKEALNVGGDRPVALRQAIQACRKGGTVSIPGVYGGPIDRLNFGAAFSKGLTLKMGQTHVQKYLAPLLNLIEANRIDPSFVISHQLSLDDAAYGYKIFHEKSDHCTKIVLHPN